MSSEAVFNMFQYIWKLTPISFHLSNVIIVICWGEILKPVLVIHSCINGHTTDCITNTIDCFVKTIRLIYLIN